MSRWNWHHGVVQFNVFLTVWHNFYCGDPDTRDSGFKVARGSVAPMRLRSQNRKHDVTMTRMKCQGGLILGDVRREGDRQNRPGGEKRLPPVRELFKVPELRFWGKNTWNFFLFCTIARVLFYECSP